MVCKILAVTQQRTVISERWKTNYGPYACPNLPPGKSPQAAGHRGASQWTLWVEEMEPEFIETKLVRDHLQKTTEETPVQREASKVFRGLPVTTRLRGNQCMHVEICPGQRKSRPKDEMNLPVVQTTPGRVPVPMVQMTKSQSP